jgi:hypothetical protein
LVGKSNELEREKKREREKKIIAEEAAGGARSTRKRETRSISVDVTNQSINVHLDPAMLEGNQIDTTYNP